MCEFYVDNSDYNKIYAALDKGGDIYFKEGEYTDIHLNITKPVRLHGKGAHLTGAKPVKWEKEGKYLVCGTRGDSLVKALVVEGKLRTMCRYPETGYISHDSVFNVQWLSSTAGGWERKPLKDELDRVEFSCGQLSNITVDHSQITIVHKWSESVRDTKCVKDNVLYLDEDAFYPPGSFGVQKCYFHNVPQSFKNEGTYYHDVKNNKLYYLPCEGEDENSVSYIPSNGPIISISCPDVEIEGFSMTASDINCGMIDARSFLRISLSDLCLKGCGTYGIYLSDEGEEETEATIKNVTISNVGATGIYADFRGSKNEITACRVSDTGISPGKAYMIYSIEANNCNVNNCHISNTPYTGIRFSGSNVVIENNHIENVMTTMNDGSGIYVFAGKNCIMRNNRVLNIPYDPEKKSRHAYYFDERSVGGVLCNNLAYNCYSSLNIHMSRDMQIKDNVFVNYNNRVKMSFARSTDIKIEGNILISEKDCMVSANKGGITSIKNNEVYSPKGFISMREIDFDTYKTVGEEMLPSLGNSLIPKIEYSPEQKSFKGERLEITV